MRALATRITTTVARLPSAASLLEREIHAESMTAITGDTSSQGAGSALARWTYDPWRERPRVALLAAVSALALCGLVVAAREPFLIALALCLFCVGSFSPALTSIECRIDTGGVSRHGLFGWEHRDWRVFRRVEDLPAGVLLSPYARRSWLDATRGWTLPMPAAQRPALRAHVRRLQEAAHERA